MALELDNIFASKRGRRAEIKGDAFVDGAPILIQKSAVHRPTGFYRAITERRQQAME
jgi:hypothetical protein